MRRSVVGIAIVFASLSVAPRVAQADLNYPPIASYINPSTITWFYGCADALPGGCLTIGIGRTLPPNTDRYVGAYGISFKTPSGVNYTLFDTFTWFLPDGSCFGSGDDISIAPNNCFITGMQNGQPARLTAQIEYLNPSPGPLFARAPVLLTAVPEPAPIALAATGLLTIGVLGLSRRRRSKFAA